MTTAGQQVIIELKRADRPMMTLDLVAQGARYRTMLAQVLAGHITSPTDPAPRTAADFARQIDVVFVLGNWPENPEGNSDPTRTAEHLLPIRGRVVTYDQLVGNARKAYDAYLREHATVNRVSRIADALMVPLPPGVQATSSVTSEEPAPAEVPGDAGRPSAP